MLWAVYALSAGAMWAGHMVFLRILAEKFPAALVATLFYIFAFATTAIIYFLSKRTDVSLADLSDKKVIFAIIGAGVTIGLTDYLFSRGLSFAPPMILYAPTFTIIGLTISSIACVLIFGDALSPTKIFGFILAMAGVALLAR